MAADGQPAGRTRRSHRNPAQRDSGRETTVRAIVDAFAEGVIHRGVAIGVGVGVIDARSGFAQTYTFGQADAVSGDPFRADTIFAIGSTTKVFTTNLLGQAVFENKLRLDNTLSQFQRAFGMFVDPLTSLVSLGELGDFTAGFPNYAPICKYGAPPRTTGCRPSQRPSRGEYASSRLPHLFPQLYREDRPAGALRLFRLQHRFARLVSRHVHKTSRSRIARSKVGTLRSIGGS